jgi:hypothetical protein
MEMQTTPHGHGLKYRDYFIYPRIEGERGRLKALGFVVRDEAGQVVHERHEIYGLFDTPAKAQEAIAMTGKAWIDAEKQRLGLD